jgi:hypothetical protein
MKDQIIEALDQKDGSLTEGRMDNWADEADGEMTTLEMDGEEFDAVDVNGTKICIFDAGDLPEDGDIDPPSDGPTMVVVSGRDQVWDWMNDPEQYAIDEDYVRLQDENGHDEVRIER